jgi:methionyl-tRNA formyltransferase
MLATARTPIGRKTAGELTAELAELGATLMVDVLRSLETLAPIPQPDAGVTYAAKIEKQEARLDFSAGAAQAERQVRAFNPVPGAWFEHGSERIKLLRGDVVDVAGEPGRVLDERLTIACGEAALRPTLVQRAGRAPMSAEELLRGFPIPAGTLLR